MVLASGFESVESVEKFIEVDSLLLVKFEHLQENVIELVAELLPESVQFH